MSFPFAFVGLPAYFVVKFLVDDCVSSVPANRIVEPPAAAISVGENCTVKWTDGDYKANVLAKGVNTVVVHLPVTTFNIVLTAASYTEATKLEMTFLQNQDHTDPGDSEVNSAEEADKLPTPKRKVQ